MSLDSISSEEKAKLKQLVDEGCSVLQEVDDLKGGLRDTVKAIAEELKTYWQEMKYFDVTIKPLEWDGYVEKIQNDEIGLYRLGYKPSTNPNPLKRIKSLINYHKLIDLNDEEKELLENNKLIAEFMGGKNFDKNGYFEIFIPEQVNNLETNKGWVTEVLEWTNYHKSWDWLMPVVEKIESIENYRFDFEIRQSLVEIYDKDEQIDVFQEQGDDKREVTYWCVVEFIKWYNENK